VNKGVFINCPVAITTIWGAKWIYGKLIAFENGVHHAVHVPQPAVLDSIDVIVSVEKQLYADLISVGKQTYFLTVYKPTDYMTATPLTNQSAALFGQALLNVIRKCTSSCFRVPSVSIDGESAAATITSQLEAIGARVDQRKC
jgi:hypothetical protein